MNRTAIRSRRYARRLSWGCAGARPMGIWARRSCGRTSLYLAALRGRS